MKIYTYSKAQEKLADILEESKKEEVVIRRRKGDMFSIVPKSKRIRSPFDVLGLGAVGRYGQESSPPILYAKRPCHVLL